MTAPKNRLLDHQRKILGKKYGRLTVVGFTKGSRKNHAKVLCICECGKNSNPSYSDLMSGHTKSCGCLSREITTRLMLTHGDTRNKKSTKEYMIWAKIKDRCTNKAAKDYKYYGGRGINLCKEWFSYESFLKDMGRKPFPSATIERKENNKGYNKENCIWATREVQAKNRRNTKITKEIYEKIILMKKNGLGISAVANFFSLPISTVGNVWYGVSNGF